MALNNDTTKITIDQTETVVLWKALAERQDRIDRRTDEYATIAHLRVKLEQAIKDLM